MGNVHDLIKEKLSFIQEGNGIREKAIILLKDLKNFEPRFFRRNVKDLSTYEIKLFDLYEKFLDYDRRAGLWSESLAVAIVTEQNNQTRYPNLEERTVF